MPTLSSTNEVGIARWILAVSAVARPLGRALPLGRDVGYQLAFELADLVFEQEFSFLQALDQ